MSKKYVSTRSISGTRDNAGTGFVVIPDDQDIKKFTEFCYRTGTVSLLLENGGIINDVLISKAALNEIDFPESFKALGSQLIWINQPRKNQPIALGSISKTNEFVNFNRNKSSLRRATKGFVSELLVDAEKGCVIINSNSSNESGGDIYIISINKNKDSKLNLIISGSINARSQYFNIESSKKFSFLVKDKSVDEKITEINYEKGVGFSYKDEFGNQCYLNDKNIQFKPKNTFNIGEGKEPIPLGNTLGKFFEDILDEVSKSQVTTVMGPMPLLNAALIEALKLKIEIFKSKISNTD